MSFNSTDITTIISCKKLREIRKTTVSNYSASVQYPFTMSTAEHSPQCVTVIYHWKVWGELTMLYLIMSEGEAVKGVGIRCREKLYFRV